MATSPLFVASLTVLKAKLRLSGLAGDRDADEILNEAILTVRTNFIRRLGMPRVTALLAMAFTEAPTTDNDLTRAVANVTEVDWVRWELMRTLPTMFQDASGDKMDVFNREAPFRQSQRSELVSQATDLMERIEQNLVLLAGDHEAQAETSIQGGVIESDETPPRPFETIFPNGIADTLSGTAIRTVYAES